MNKIITLIAVFFTAFAMTLTACGKEDPLEPVPNNPEDEIPVIPDKPDEPDSPDNDSKTLVVYYSHSGNTRRIGILMIPYS